MNYTYKIRIIGVWAPKKKGGKEKFMRLVYPTLIKQVNELYYVFVPDLDIHEQEKSLAGAIEIARDAIGAKVIHLEIKNLELPKPSSDEFIRELIKIKRSETIDFSQGEVTFTYVDVNVQEYRNKFNQRSVKKNCTLPYWLSKKSEELGINFSKTLQEALLQKLDKK